MIIAHVWNLMFGKSKYTGSKSTNRVLELFYAWHFLKIILEMSVERKPVQRCQLSDFVAISSDFSTIIFFSKKRQGTNVPNFFDQPFGLPNYKTGRLVPPIWRPLATLLVEFSYLLWEIVGNTKPVSSPLLVILQLLPLLLINITYLFNINIYWFF